MQQQASRTVTVRDIAAHLGLSAGTVYDCLGDRYSARYNQRTVDKIRATAQQMGYVAKTRPAAQAATKRAYVRKAPTNNIFKSREEETAAMLRLRSEGHGDVEIARRCGVCMNTVYRRIGTQPAEITAAHLKLAGAVKSAKNRIKRSYQAQQQIAQYNALAAQLNQQLEAAKATAEQLKAITPASKKAAKITGTKLLVVSNILQ